MTDADIVERLRILAEHFADGSLGRNTCLTAADRIAARADYSGMEDRKSPLQPIFRDHNCGGCGSGARPCREGNYNNCSWPRARND